MNGVELTGVTRSEAVANLKNTSSPVVLRVLEMRPPNDSSLDCMPPLHSPCALSPSSPGDIKLPPPNDDYAPLWVSWLQLPRYNQQNNRLILIGSIFGLFYSYQSKYVKCNTTFFIYFFFSSLSPTFFPSLRFLFCPYLMNL